MTSESSLVENKSEFEDKRYMELPFTNTTYSFKEIQKA